MSTNATNGTNGNVADFSFQQFMDGGKPMRIRLGKRSKLRRFTFHEAIHSGSGALMAGAQVWKVDAPDEETALEIGARVLPMNRAFVMQGGELLCEVKR